MLSKFLVLSSMLFVSNSALANLQAPPTVVLINTSPDTLYFSPSNQATKYNCIDSSQYGPFAIARDSSLKLNFRIGCEFYIDRFRVTKADPNAASFFFFDLVENKDNTISFDNLMLSENLNVRFHPEINLNLGTTFDSATYAGWSWKDLNTRSLKFTICNDNQQDPKKGYMCPDLPK